MSPRMFDILRGKKDLNKPQEARESAAEKTADPDKQLKAQAQEEKVPLVNFPRKILGNKDAPENNTESSLLISQKLIKTIKRHGVDNEEEAGEIYRNGVEIIKAMFAKINSGEGLAQEQDRLNGLFDSVFNQLVLGDNLLANIYVDNDEYYLPYHIMNVLILSLAIGLKMGFNKSRLNHVGLASIFCDAGIDALKEIISQPRMLTKEEGDMVKTHIEKSLAIVNKAGFINETVKEAILMHHERVNGSGYPRGLNLSKISCYADILGLMDTYEALTHTRPYRKAMNTHDAVKLLISQLKNDFSADVMKVFINKMSVYPIGSMVELETGEKARVIDAHPGSPLRPVVMVLKGVSGEFVSERTVIDLSKQEFPSIKNPN